VQSNQWVVTEDLKFLSDPLLLGRHVVDLNATNNVPLRSYVWGLDLSESMDRAGGVGGLLWVTLHTGSGPTAGTHFCAYDGNGNVVALASASDGSATGRYEYGPFGEAIRVSGPAANQNPFRFSTKRTDNTTDLVLYEYRVYSSVARRWFTRDPLGERGGLNTCAFAVNNPVSQIDVLGLQALGGRSRPDFSCCDKETTDKGKQDLIDYYNAAKDYLEAMGAPHQGSPCGPTSCLSYALYIHKFLRPLPNCWVCWVENRRQKPSPWHETWDENAVVCESRLNGEPSERIIFDYYANRPAGENYYGWFVTAYPILVSEGAKTWDTDCQGRCKPRSGRRNYDWSILDSLLDELEKEGVITN
jgi:RHS repeat-associated protein